MNILDQRVISPILILFGAIAFSPPTDAQDVNKTFKPAIPNTPDLYVPPTFSLPERFSVPKSSAPSLDTSIARFYEFSALTPEAKKARHAAIEAFKELKKHCPQCAGVMSPEAPGVGAEPVIAGSNRIYGGGAAFLTASCPSDKKYLNTKTGTCLDSFGVTSEWMAEMKEKK